MTNQYKTTKSFKHFVFLNLTDDIIKSIESKISKKQNDAERIEQLTLQLESQKKKDQAQKTVDKLQIDSLDSASEDIDKLIHQIQVKELDNKLKN